MVKAILPDNDILGQMSRILWLLQRPEWLDLWQALRLPVTSFADFGLIDSATDEQVWLTCQEKHLVLITGNRNQDSPNSLEATIRQRNTASSLPVLTLADTRKIMRDGEYAERVAVKMLDYLMNMDQFLGTGHLYLP